jgi:hypothetical protein
VRGTIKENRDTGKRWTLNHNEGHPFPQKKWYLYFLMYTYLDLIHEQLKTSKNAREKCQSTNLMERF